MKAKLTTEIEGSPNQIEEHSKKQLAPVGSS